MIQRKKKSRTKFVYCTLIAAIVFCIFVLCRNPSRPEYSVGQLTSAVAEASEPMQNSKADGEESMNAAGMPVIIKDFPHISQKGKYPTGCESVAAVSLMQFHGVEITVEEFIDDHLPIAEYPYYEDNVMYGKNPWDAFIGDPYSESGYGCYSTAIIKAMRSAAPQSYGIHAIYNMPLSALCSDYIDKGQPVLIWATMDMQAPYEGKSWVLPNGETFTFLCPEHALVLIGYDEKSYYFCNPQSENPVVAYPKKACETAYHALHQQAIVMQIVE